jgi:hypothetical protein
LLVLFRIPQAILLRSLYKTRTQSCDCPVILTGKRGSFVVVKDVGVAHRGRYILMFARREQQSVITTEQYLNTYQKDIWPI